MFHSAGGDSAVTDSTVDRIERLEHELRRAFEDAQREADAMFAQYQGTVHVSLPPETRRCARFTTVIRTLSSSM